LPSVLLVYTPGTLLYGELMAFVQPALATLGTVYVFVEDARAEAPAGQGR
jgi:hypothetical protein